MERGVYKASVFALDRLGLSLKAAGAKETHRPTHLRTQRPAGIREERRNAASHNKEHSRTEGSVVRHRQRRRWEQQQQLRAPERPRRRHQSNLREGNIPRRKASQVKKKGKGPDRHSEKERPIRLLLSLLPPLLFFGFCIFISVLVPALGESEDARAGKRGREGQRSANLQNGTSGGAADSLGWRQDHEFAPSLLGPGMSGLRARVWRGLVERTGSGVSGNAKEESILRTEMVWRKVNEKKGKKMCELGRTGGLVDKGCSPFLLALLSVVAANVAGGRRRRRLFPS